MKTNYLMQLYGVGASGIIGILGGFSKYDFYWTVFLVGGLVTLVGHSIVDKNVKFSFARFVWMVITSFLSCFMIKILYNEGAISTMTMIISTLVASMVAPAVLTKLLRDLPTMIADGILKIPDILVNSLKNRLDNNDKNNNDE